MEVYRRLQKLAISVLKSKRTLTPLTSVLSSLSLCSLIFTPESRNSLGVKLKLAIRFQTQQMTNKTIKHRSTQINNFKKKPVPMTASSARLGSCNRRPPLIATHKAFAQTKANPPRRSKPKFTNLHGLPTPKPTNHC